MNGDQIRESFIQFFESKGHLHMPSASLIPAGDPTLLFTSAGMVPFKPFFMGEQTPPRRRLTSHQKSFRTTDIDEVGDHKHLTFFEMLGNFSIGDYFKNDAVAFAWELITQTFQLEPERIYVTIHLDDDEAFAIWQDEIGVPVERIYRYGDSDNWWGPAGSEGPTGPCSELHYDAGPERGCGPMINPDALTAQFLRERDGAEPTAPPGCHPNCDCERFVELWNLVFMQFYQDPERNRTPLPAPSVDTGMGLERAAAVLQGKPNVYETDLFWPIVQSICQLSGQAYGQNLESDYAIRVVAEHARAASFLIADGVVPGNEGRGYVLRRIIRRAMRYGRRLGLQQAFLTKVAEVALDRFGPVYRELEENRGFILRVIGLEEERFQATVEVGLAELYDSIAGIWAGLQTTLRLPESSQELREIFRNSSTVERIQESARYFQQAVRDTGTIERIQEAARAFQRVLRSVGAAGTPLETTPPGLVVSGEDTFRLYDTRGFPPELTQEIAQEHGLSVDMEGFEREMEAQRARARASQSFSGAMEMLTAYENLGVGDTHFVGYQKFQQESVVAALLVEPEDTGGHPLPAGRAVQGQRVEVVLQETPFYAESGGQVGDQGTISGPNGMVAVEDTQSPVAGLIVHRGVVQHGDISLGEPVAAMVDPRRRMDAARNHSGTHLLHAALRSVLGPHVRQAGSLVAPGRLRFDFSHVGPLTPAEQGSVQRLANEKVRQNLGVSTQETSYAEAVREGALAFFGDRYGDVVRVVTMANGEPFSVEVCGGTHVHATGEVGTLFVLGESGIGGGMRRIEAITGRAAEELYVEQSARLESLARKLQSPVVDLEARLDGFLQDTEELRRRVARLERTALRAEAEKLLNSAVEVSGVRVVVGKTSATNPEAMREMGDFVRARLSSVALVLGAVVNGSPILVAMVTPDLVARGLHAGNIARDTAKVVGGGGGGQPEMAQAGGRNAAKLDEALQGVSALVRAGLSS